MAHCQPVLEYLDKIITIENNEEFHILTVGVVVEAMLNTNKEEQKKIKQVLIQIDMKNGDVLDFIKFCAKILVNNH